MYKYMLQINMYEYIYTLNVNFRYRLNNVEIKKIYYTGLKRVISTGWPLGTSVSHHRRLKQERSRRWPGIPKGLMNTFFTRPVVDTKNIPCPQTSGRQFSFRSCEVARSSLLSCCYSCTWFNNTRRNDCSKEIRSMANKQSVYLRFGIHEYAKLHCCIHEHWFLTLSGLQLSLDENVMIGTWV